jgi:hypothetical protein
MESVKKCLITKQEAEYQIKAVTTIKWQDFNIEDPSILIAKLDQLVKIKVLITLRAKEV